MKHICALILMLFTGIFVAQAQYSHSYSDSLLHLGDAQYKRGDYSDSKITYQAAIEKFSLDTSDARWIIAAVGLGASLLDLGEVNNGAEWIFKADSAITSKTPLELQAYVKSNVGWASWWVGNNLKAFEDYKTALDLAQQSDDVIRVGQVSNSIAILAHDLGYFKDALNYARTSVQFLRSVNEQYRLAMALSNLSTYYSEAGLYENAISALTESLKIKRELENKDLIASDYVNFAEVYKKQGNYDLALHYYIQYLDLTEQLFARGKQIRALHSIGNLYNSLNKPEQALYYFNKSAELEKEANFTPHPNNLLAISNSYKELGDFNSAKKHILEALSAFKQKNETLNITDAHLKLADLYYNFERYEDALTEIKIAEDNINSTESLRLKGDLNHIKSSVYAAINNYPKAIQATHKALTYSAFLPSDVKAERLMNAARLHYQINSDSSYIYADYAIDEIERARLSIRSESLQPNLFKKYAQFYNEVAGWYLTKKNNIDIAFELVERGKSRTLLDKLASNVALEDLADENDLIEVNRLEQDLKKLYLQLDTTIDSVLIKTLQDQIIDAELDYDHLINNLYRNDTNLNLLGSSGIVSLADIQQLNSDDSAFIEYFFAGNKLYTIWITNTDKGFFVNDEETNISDNINNHINRFRSAIEEIENFATLKELSEPLHDKLLSNFFRNNSHIKNLVIVPDRSIAYLPFDALIVNNKYLIENHNFKYLPSASLYKFIQDGPKSDFSLDLLALAGSNYSVNSAGEFNTHINIASLPASLLEVDFVSEQFTDKTVIYEGDLAETAFIDMDLNAYKYIHLASHAFVNEQNPLQSGLLLTAGSELDYTAGNYLTSLEISGLKLNADLVVLSACNTGYGSIIEGEGLLGLQRSFLKAGASSVLVSLWSIYDRSTAIFMRKFYQKLSILEKEEFSWWNKVLQYFSFYEPPLFDHRTKANRDAKLFMLEHPYYNHPVYWAPFILIGK